MVTRVRLQIVHEMVRGTSGDPETPLQPDIFGGIVLKGPGLLNVLVEHLPRGVPEVLFESPFGHVGADRPICVTHAGLFVVLLR